MAYPDELLVSISCRMSQGETQREIADDMKINESTLSRIVKVAKERGILLEHRYEVRVPEDVAVAKRIGERFGVDCHVAIDSSHGVECLAAAIFREWFASDDYGSSIVLDGGRTIGGFVSMCAGISPKRIRVVPIFSDPPSYEFSALQLTIQMASVCKGEACYLPFLCSPSANRNEKFIELESTARAAAGQAKMILLGCGPWKSGFTSLALFEHLGHSPEEILTKYPRVVGLSGYVPLDCRGRQVPVEELYNERMSRSIGLEGLRQMSARRGTCRVVLVCDDAKKVPAIKAVMAAEMTNTLIVNYATASALLRSND